MFAAAPKGRRLSLVSGFLAKFFELRGALLHSPFVDGLDIEPPVTADFETGQLTLLKQTVDGRTVNSEVIGQFTNGQNFRVSKRLVSFEIS
jgi:hypothetical protein